MNLLAIETTSSACSVALSVAQRVFHRHEVLNNQHSQYLLSYIDELLSEAGITQHQLQKIAVGQGPGSFTGVRLGMAAAQGIAYAQDIPLVAISSLKNLAAQVGAGQIFVAIDARMGEVYWQCFHRQSDGTLESISEAKLSKPQQIQLPNIDGRWFGVGSGWDQYADILEAHLANSNDDWQANALPNALITLQLAAQETSFADVNQAAVPHYLRDKVTN